MTMNHSGWSMATTQFAFKAIAIAKQMGIPYANQTSTVV